MQLSILPEFVWAGVFLVNVSFYLQCSSTRAELLIYGRVFHAVILALLNCEIPHHCYTTEFIVEQRKHLFPKEGVNQARDINSATQNCTRITIPVPTDCVMPIRRIYRYCWSYCARKWGKLHCINSANRSALIIFVSLCCGQTASSSSSSVLCLPLSVRYWSDFVDSLRWNVWQNGQ